MERQGRIALGSISCFTFKNSKGMARTNFPAGSTERSCVWTDHWRDDTGGGRDSSVLKVSAS